MRIIKSIEILNNGYCNILYNDYEDDDMLIFIGHHRESRHISEVSTHDFAPVAALNALKNLYPKKNEPLTISESDKIKGKIASLEMQIMDQKIKLFTDCNE